MFAAHPLPPLQAAPPVHPAPPVVPPAGAPPAGAPPADASPGGAQTAPPAPTTQAWPIAILLSFAPSAAAVWHCDRVTIRGESKSVRHTFVFKHWAWPFLVIPGK